MNIAVINKPSFKIFLHLYPFVIMYILYQQIVKYNYYWTLAHWPILEGPWVNWDTILAAATKAKKIIAQTKTLISFSCKN